MTIDLAEITAWNEKYRLKFINSVSGYKGVHLIGTQDSEGKTNVAIFNSIVHIGASPPLIGFIMRPVTVERNTYDNLKKSGYYTINHVHKSFFKKAHYTSAKFPKNVSEFDECGLKEYYLSDFPAPFVNESKIKLGLELKEDLEIKENGTRLIVGEIQKMIVEESLVEPDGQLDLEMANDVCVTGLNQYSSVSKFQKLPYARQNEIPNFKQKERPDNVVFDEESQCYNANLLPYGTNIGAPSIRPTGVSTWKNSSIGSFNHAFNNKIESLKNTYQKLIDEYKTNDLVYNASMNFEPIVGQTYHLYLNEKTNEQFLSLIPPSSWKKKHIGAFKLNHEKVWQEITN